MGKEVKVNREFEKLIRPLTEEEYEGLEKSIVKNGCREAILTWKGDIVDGHHRYKICKKNDIKYDVEEMEFEDETEAKIFIVENQRARRNLNAYERGELNLTLEELYANQAKERQRVHGGTAPGKSLVTTLSQVSAGKTRTKLAKKSKVSEGTMDKIKIITHKGTEEQKKKLRTGDTTINKVYKEIRSGDKDKRIEEEAQQRKEAIVGIDIRKGDFKEALKDVYNIDAIITDPPYPKEHLDCFSDLSLYASKHLKEDGFCVVYSGQYHLPEVIKRLSEHLTYVWTFCLFLVGKKQLVMGGIEVMCGWKPVLVFSRGRKKLRFPAYDVLTSKKWRSIVINGNRAKAGLNNL